MVARFFPLRVMTPNAFLFLLSYLTPRFNIAMLYNIIVIEDRCICNKSGSKENDKSIPGINACRYSIVPFLIPLLQHFHLFIPLYIPHTNQVLLHHRVTIQDILVYSKSEPVSYMLPCNPSFRCCILFSFKANRVPHTKHGKPVLILDNTWSSV